MKINIHTQFIVGTIIYMNVISLHYFNNNLVEKTCKVLMKIIASCKTKFATHNIRFLAFTYEISITVMPLNWKNGNGDLNEYVFIPKLSYYKCEVNSDKLKYMC